MLSSSDCGVVKIPQLQYLNIFQNITLLMLVFKYLPRVFKYLTTVYSNHVIQLKNMHCH